MFRYITISLFVAFFYYSCTLPELFPPVGCEGLSDEETFPCRDDRLLDIQTKINSNKIFNNSLLIEIPQYSYSTPNQLIPLLGNVIELNGDSSLYTIVNNNDCCNLLQVIDKHSDRPVLKWKTIQADFIATAIFSKTIRTSLNDHRIENDEDVVWTWNNSMGMVSQTNGITTIEYNDGKDMIDGEIKESTTPLETGELYVWAVWAWNEAGTEIMFSSRSIPFIVEPRDFSVKSFLQLRKNWELESAVRQGIDITDIFPVKEMKITVNCDSSQVSYNLQSGNIQGTMEEGQPIVIEIDSIRFSDFVLLCDEQFLANAELNNEQVEVVYHEK